MGLLCFIFLICSLRTNIAFFIIFLSLVVAFGLLTGAYFALAADYTGNAAMANKLVIVSEDSCDTVQLSILTQRRVRVLPRLSHACPDGGSCWPSCWLLSTFPSSFPLATCPARSRASPKRRGRGHLATEVKVSRRTLNSFGLAF